MTVISGVLTAPDGRALPSVSINLKALATSSAVVVQTESASVTDASGNYSISAAVGQYQVTISAYGQPEQFVGNIQVFADSADGTLNDFLTTPGEEILTPVIVATVQNMRRDAQAAAKTSLDARDAAQGYAIYAEAVSEGGATYASTSAGLAATTTGQYFRVPQGTGAVSSFIYYLNNSGSALAVADAVGKAAVDVVAASIVAIINNNDVGPSVTISSSSIPTVVQDETGKVFLPGMVRSIQDTTQPYQTDKRSFFIKRISDLDGTLLEASDQLGYMHLPNMEGSLQTVIKKHSSKIKILTERRQNLNAKEYGLRDRIGFNNTPVLQALINYVSTLPSGGSIYIPEGDYRFKGSVIPRNNVNIIGAGIGKTVLYQMDTVSLFLYYTGTQVDPGQAPYLTNCLFADFTIDGQYQVLPSTGYTAGIKGMYFQFFSRIFIQRVEICNTGATGLGIDFALNSSITDCILSGNGRLANVGDPGASGIGIGTGGAVSEPLYIGGNLCTGNRNFGIFCEHQGRTDSPYTSRNTIIANNNCSGNNAGLGDCGLDGLVATGNDLSDNTGYGFLLSRGTVPAAFAGKNGIFNDNQVCRNGADGISFDVSLANSGGYYLFADNNILDNVGNGVRLQGGGNRPIQGIDLSGNVMARNGYHGILGGSATLNTVFIKNNSLLSNGGDGILLDNGTFNTGRIFGNELYRNQQYGMAGSCALTSIDISENHFLANVVGAANLTGAQISVTIGRNPGWSV